MRSAEHMRTRLIWAFSLLFALSVASRAQQPAAGLDEQVIRSAIEAALNVAPRHIQALVSPNQAGVRLVDVEVERLGDGRDRITIDLNQRALTYGDDVEHLTAHLIERTARLTAGSGHVDYHFLVGGVPLDQFVSRPAGPQRQSLQVGVPRRVVISAGHGWYRHEPSNSWRLQRDYFWGIVEDLVNWEITHYLRLELLTSDFDVRPARHPDRNAGGGVSGHPRWQESAKYYIRDLGAPSSTWDFGVDDYAKDINSRPFYANWIDAALMVSIHNNGGQATGTETWYDTSNAFESESRRLAEIVNSKVVSAIRARFNPTWVDRGLRSCNGCKGETRLAARPAVLVEVAFMDTKSPDNDALHSEAFKLFVAQAIRDGIQEFVGTGAGGSDPAARVRTELIARAARDARFGEVVAGSSGADMNWDAGWELRWLDFHFAGDRRVRLYHAVSRTDPRARFVGFWDPDTNTWQGWERV